MGELSTNRAREEFIVDADYRIVDENAIPIEAASLAADGATADEQPALIMSLLRELVETVVLSLILFLLIRQVVQNYRIESTSMEPNFHEGQFVLVNKLAFKLGEPKRGEVVVFHNPDMPEEDYIKRIIGLPGDVVELHDAVVYVNGKALPEPFQHGLMPDGYNWGPITVEPDRLFVMGDNRPNSKDSRAIGQINEDLIVGKAWLRVFPFDKFGLIQQYDLAPAG
jgi:signal peptidase I